MRAVAVACVIASAHAFWTPPSRTSRVSHARHEHAAPTTRGAGETPQRVAWLSSDAARVHAALWQTDETPLALTTCAMFANCEDVYALVYERETLLCFTLEEQDGRTLALHHVRFAPDLAVESRAESGELALKYAMKRCRATRACVGEFADDRVRLEFAYVRRGS